MTYLEDTRMATYCLHHDYLDLFLFVYFSFIYIYIFFCVCICLFSLVVYCCIICCTIVKCFLRMCICSYMCMHVFCISGKEERPWPIARD